MVESWPPVASGYAARSSALVAAQHARADLVPAVLVSSRQHVYTDGAAHRAGREPRATPAPPRDPDGPDGPDAPDDPDGPDAPDDPDGPDGSDAAAVPVRVVLPSTRERRRRRLRRWGVDPHRLRRAVVAAGRAHDADVVHVHWGSTIGSAAARAADDLGVPLVAEVRFDLASAVLVNGLGRDPAVLGTVLRRWFERHLPRADAIVLAGHALAPLVAGVAPDHAQEVVVVAPNGVDPTTYRPGAPPTGLRQRLGLPPDGLVVGSVTNLLGYEGLDRLVDALAALGRDDVTGLVVGDGPARRALRDRADAAGVRLVLPGRVDAGTAAAAWRLLDVVVVPRPDVAVTRWASPLKVTEAMACGRAVLATAVGGSATLLADGRGALVPPDDHGALVAALASLLVSPRRRASLGAAAREHAVARLRWADAAAVHVDAYRAATARRVRSSR